MKALRRNVPRHFIRGDGVRSAQYQNVTRRFLVIRVERTYNDAIDVLNNLQTSHKILMERRDAGIRIDMTANEEMRRCLSGIGYSQNDLTRLNIIHVAGTKGKGTTCAYVASILTEYGKAFGLPRSVGLFTSPHLIAVRERIRINGQPLPAPLFAKYFFEVWDALDAAAAKSEIPLSKPVYFRYLTLMSYHAFIREGVDCTVYETGVGGEYDSTNIVDQPTATGISTLGIDHVYTLGETIEQIAWHKAGIQKKDAASFTVEQLPGAWEVIKQRANERQVRSLQVVRPGPLLAEVKIQPNEAFQRTNAALAIALAEECLKKLAPRQEALLVDYALPQPFIDGLEKVVWRGRCETKVENGMTWYLDGAHTVDSIIVATRWFSRAISKSSGSRVLIFNQQGDHDATILLETLFKSMSACGVKFDHVIFCTNTANATHALNKDLTNLGYDGEAITNLELQKTLAEKWRTLDTSSSRTAITILPGIDKAIEHARSLRVDIPNALQVEALITGSVHLVGAALGVLEGVDAL